MQTNLFLSVGSNPDVVKTCCDLFTTAEKQDFCRQIKEQHPDSYTDPNLLLSYIYSKVMQNYLKRCNERSISTTLYIQELISENMEPLYTNVSITPLDIAYNLKLDSTVIFATMGTIYICP